MQPVLSKEPCPFCGGHTWRSYKQDKYTGELRQMCGSKGLEAIVDLPHVLGEIPGFDVDECVVCGATCAL